MACVRYGYAKKANRQTKGSGGTARTGDSRVPAGGHGPRPPRVAGGVRRERLCLVRAGVERQLADFVPKAVAIARDKSVHIRRRLRMMRFLNRACITNLALHAPEVFPKPSRPSEPSA